MQPSQIQIVQSTWREVAPHAQGAALIFYARLIELDPSLRRFFPADLHAHAVVLRQTLGNAVLSLDELETVAPALEMLGRRHVDCGVRDRDYDAFGHALLDTLASILGAAFTPPVRHAWAETYGAITGIMRRAGSEHVARRRAAAVRAAIADRLGLGGVSGSGLLAAFS
jgi:hemoglobin-like flavoprotein